MQQNPTNTDRSASAAEETTFIYAHLNWQLSYPIQKKASYATYNYRHNRDNAYDGEKSQINNKNNNLNIYK